jgi:ABC-type nitrate/sulfonate/bicarbonate transport system permease component
MAFKETISKYQRPLLGVVSVVGLIFAWEIAFTYLLPLDPFFFTKPSLIAVAFKEQTLSGALWKDLAISSKAFFWGFSLAVIVGIPVGVFMGWRRRAEYVLDPFLTALYASPLVALAPLFIIIFGVGLTGKVALIFLLAVFPFVFNVFSGVKCTDRLLVNVVQSFGGKERDIYFKVILPSILPYIVAGARIAIGRGIVGILVAEYYAASEGIGFAISRFGDTFRLPEMFAAIFLLMIVAVIFTEGLRKLETLLAPWKIGQEAR